MKKIIMFILVTVSAYAVFAACTVEYNGMNSDILVITNDFTEDEVITEMKKFVDLNKGGFTSSSETWVGGQRSQEYMNNFIPMAVINGGYSVLYGGEGFAVIMINDENDNFMNWLSNGKSYSKDTLSF